MGILVEKKTDDFVERLKRSRSTLGYVRGNAEENKKLSRELIDMYSNLLLPDDVVVVIYDTTNAATYWVSENIKSFMGYDRSELMGSDLNRYVRIFKPKHEKYIFKMHMLRERLGRISLGDEAALITGLEVKSRIEERCKIFINQKAITITKEGFPSLVTSFCRKVTHLMTGDDYFLKIVSGKKSVSHFSNKKRVQKDIVTSVQGNIIKLAGLDHLSSAEIGQQLNLSKQTVDAQRKKIKSKLSTVSMEAAYHLCQLNKVF